MPFDNWFKNNEKEVKVQKLLIKAKEYLNEMCELRIIKNDSIEPRVGWILINLGIFIEEFE